MRQFLADLWHGEPVMVTGLISAGLTAALAALGADAPLALTIGAPVWVAAATFYARSKVSPL